MITKFDIYIKEKFEAFSDEISYILDNFGVKVKIEEEPTGILLTFPNNITTKEPWFFKFLQLSHRVRFRIDIDRNTITLTKRRDIDDDNEI